MNTSTTSWQQLLAEGFTDIESLCQHLQLVPNQLPLLLGFKDFPLRVPRGFVDCMEKGNPNDPLLRQILPIQDELVNYPGYNADPVGDLNAVAAAGVIHKYQGRVLLIATGACAVHCRYCFRRNFPYGEQQLSNQKLQQAISFIAEHSDISEVILSGGDPLLLNDDKLGFLLQQLANIKHVQRIRLHSRVPIVLPARITDSLLTHLSNSNQQIVMVLHSNHGNELSPSVAAACLKIRQHGITLLNQSVLLKAVNDDANTLCQLSEKLFSLGILPYYLHLLDHAIGTGHFAVDDHTAKQLLEQMQRQLPGYLVPKLVREQAGAAYKLPIS
ncbi:MAG: EF-P beta-lysylation protein EpmB [Methylomonas sp.]